MKCFTIYRHPGGALKYDPGISVVKTVHFNGQLCVRLGMNGFLSSENILELGSGKREPVIQDGKNGLKILYDAAPVEYSIGTISHRWVLCRPVRDDDSVCLVRFNFGAQVPESCRCDVFPETGSPTPIGIASVGASKRPWPYFYVDGMWITSPGDVFCITPVSRQSVRVTIGADSITAD